jgi:hypothetical protein
MANARTNQQDGNTPKKSNRGFASMDAARQREIASQGGRAAHLKGTAHEFTSEEARAAGSKSHKSGRAMNRTAAAGGSAGRPDSGAGASRNGGAGGGGSARGGDSIEAAGTRVRDSGSQSRGNGARDVETETASQTDNGESPVGI